MKRIRLTVAYDGTNYSGWQIQKGKKTVEGELNRALCELTGEEIRVIGASRTDAGVHACGNVAVFDTDSPIPADRFCYAVNQRLPEDIRAVRSEEVSPQWHPRREKGVKVYEYRIYNERFEEPMHRLYAYHCGYPLSLGSMRAAAEHLIGVHDFTSFANPDSQVLKEGGSAVREIYDITILVEHGRRSEVRTAGEREHEDQPERGFYGMMTIRVSGSGFLYNMVRIMAGTLLQVGSGRLAPADIPSILEARDRTKAGPTAEAKGLCLVKLDYD